LRTALAYAVTIPFVGFLITQNPMIGWVIFALTFGIFGLIVLYQLASYTGAPRGPNATKPNSDAGLNPLASLTDLVKTASKPGNIFTSEVLANRIRQAFLTKIRLVMDLSPSDVRQLVSDRIRLSQVVHDPELLNLAAGRLNEVDFRTSNGIDSLLSKMEGWTYEGE
jgi:hypothetical protein